MTGFLAPRVCEKKGICICAGFAGLDDESYDKLEIALNDGQYQIVERDVDSPWYSESVTFTDLEFGVFYKLCGRITQGGKIQDISILLCARDWSEHGSSHPAPVSGGISSGAGGIIVEVI